jgi:hypothetical protein
MIIILLPMSFSSTGTFSSHSNAMEGEIIPTRCVCNLPIKKCIEMGKLQFIHNLVHKLSIVTFDPLGFGLK